MLYHGDCYIKKRRHCEERVKRGAKQSYYLTLSEIAPSATLPRNDGILWNSSF